MFNLDPEDIDPRAVLLQGQKPWSMVAGAGPDRGFDVALFVGYHTRAGHPTGTIAHTYSGLPTLTTLQGRPVGESGINALPLGAWGIPVGLVSGDDELARETEAWLPWAEKVIVKSVVSRRSAASVHPTVARERVRAGAERRSAGRRRASCRCSTSGVRWSSLPSTRTRARPTTRRSSPALSAMGIAACAS